MQEPRMDDIVFHESAESEPVENFETRAVWFFEEFWPMMVFGFLFVLMCSLPIILSPQFSELNRFSTSDVVWPPYGLIIMASFLVALLVTFVAPRLVGLYILLLSILALVVAEQGQAWTVGPSIAIIFLAYVLVGITVLPQRKEKNTAGH